MKLLTAILLSVAINQKLYYMRILFTILLSLFVITSYSQIEVGQSVPKNTIGKIKAGGQFIADLTYEVADNDTTYTIMYNNAEYKIITDFQSISFSGEDGTLEKLYEVLKSFFSNENKKNKEYKVELKLGSSHVILSNFRIMGITSIMFHTPDGYFILGEKHLNKLFGKK